MSQQDIEQLLDRYLDNTATAQERQQVEKWLDQSNNAGSEWTGMNANTRTQWLNSVYADVRTKANIGGRVISLWQKLAAVAAAILILAFAVILIRNRPGQQFADLSTGTDQRQLTLSDSSRIWVNSGSELKYPKTFTGKTREVYLVGEAYFDIHHDAARPFLIHTGKVITTVLGTAFNIKTDQKNHTVIVTVTRGKVSVSQEGKVLAVLTPNQQLKFDSKIQKAQEAPVDAKQAISWQQELHFEDISFADAGALLEKRFGNPIHFNNQKIKNCRFTGTSIQGDDMDQILKVLCAFNNATYQKQADGSILIDGPGCAN